MTQIESIIQPDRVLNYFEWKSMAFVRISSSFHPNIIAQPKLTCQYLETVFVAGEAVGAMMYTFKQPVLYAHLNHNFIEAFLLGAATHINVGGESNYDLMEQVKKPGSIDQ
jgi:hypothetical protein